MKSLQPFSIEEDLLELSKQGFFPIMLDENLRVLESALEDDGFQGHRAASRVKPSRS